MATFSNDYVEFGKDYTSIIVWLPSKIQILNPDNLQTLQEIPGVFYFPPCIDSKTGLIGVDGNIYDANSGIKRGGIRVWGLKQFYLNGLYFVNGYYRYVPAKQIILRVNNDF